jgi:hypothetical protein
MVNPDEISKFIGAHGNWKARLKEAIDIGTSEFKVENVRRDDLCNFGKWLYSLPPADQQSVRWKNVRELHAKFHIEAALVLDLALKGKKQEAKKAVDLGGSFAHASGAFTRAMMEWKSELS